MARRINEIKVVIGAETTKLGAALKDSEDKARGLTKELREIKSVQRFNPDSLTLVSQRARVSGEQIKALTEKYKTLKDADAQMSAQMGSDDFDQTKYDALQREIIKTEDQVKNLARETAMLPNEFDKAFESAAKAGEKMSTAGKTLTVGVTTPLIAAGGAALKTSIDFETAFTDVTKTVSGAPEEIEKLRQSIRQLATEQPITAGQLAQIAALGGQLGIATEDLMAFTEVISGLDVATDMNAEEAATQLAQLANITGLTADNYDNFASTVVGLGNNMATTESAVMAMAMRIAGAGTQVGLTEAEMLAMSAAMTSVGISAEAGGSAFSKLMSQIDKDIALGSDAVELWAQTAGMSADEFASAWETRPAEALQSLIEGLGGAHGETENLNIVLEELGITELRQTDMMKRLAGASDLMGEAVDLANESWEENSALQDEVANKNESTGAKLQTLKNNVDEVAMSFADSFLPILQDVVAKAQEFAQRVAGMSDENKRMVLTVAAIAAAVGPVLLVVGKTLVLMNQARQAYVAIKGAIAAYRAGLALAAAAEGTKAGATVASTVATKAAAAAQRLLNAAMRANPIGIIITIIMALVAAIVYLWNTNEDFRNAVTAAWEAIKNAVGAAVEWLGEKFNALKEWLGGVGEKAGQLKDGISGKWDEIKAKTGEAWDNVKSKIGDSLDGAKQTVTTKASEIASNLSGKWNNIQNTAGTIWNGIQFAIENPMQAAQMAATGANSIMERLLGDKWNSIRNTATNVFNGVKNAIINPIETAKNTVNGIVETIKGFFSNMSLKLPSIQAPKLPRLPQIRITGSFGINPIRTPSIRWNKEGAIFRFPTVLPTMAGLQGFAEPSTGGEAIMPLNKLVPMMADAMKMVGASGGSPIIVQSMTVRSDDDIRSIARELNTLQTRQRGWL